MKMKMKKFLIAALIAITISTAAFGAVSGDVYLRQDVFEAKMDAFMAEIRLMNEQTRAELNEKIQANTTAILSTNARIDVTNAKIDATNNRVETLITMVYWGIALLGILISLATWGPSLFQKFKDSKPSLTLEDVERLIDAKLQAKNL
ncbi:MAG: hypothetical protein IJG30_03730 [Synergistaceae bacterium]|nr:hypothetical protein [Synergistaceae bacterium]